MYVQQEEILQDVNDQFESAHNAAMADKENRLFEAESEKIKIMENLKQAQLQLKSNAEELESARKLLSGLTQAEQNDASLKQLIEKMTSRNDKELNLLREELEGAEKLLTEAREEKQTLKNILDLNNLDSNPFSKVMSPMPSGSHEVSDKTFEKDFEGSYWFIKLEFIEFK